MRSKQTLATIHGLRGVAALMVVLMHFSSFTQAVAPGLSTFLAKGYLGVDAFFVISGFIIYISTEEAAARDSVSFFIRRFCRVALPAWVALWLAVLVHPPYLRDLVFSALFIPLQNANPPFYGYSVLIVAWTLTYELFFYLLFATALSVRFGRAHRGLVTVLLIVVLAALSQASNCCSLDPYQAPLSTLGGPHFPNQLISLGGNPITLEFAVGILLGWAYVNRWFERIGGARLLFAMPLVVGLIVSFQYNEGHGLNRGGLLAAAIVFFVLCLQATLDQRGPARQSASQGRFYQAVLRLGEISYSMYLVHPCIKSLLARLLARAPLAHTPAVATLTFIVAILAALALSALFHRWVELPSQRLGRTLSGRWAVARSRAGARRTTVGRIVVGVPVETENPGA